MVVSGSSARAVCLRAGRVAHGRVGASAAAAEAQEGVHDVLSLHAGVEQLRVVAHQSCKQEVREFHHDLTNK